MLTTPSNVREELRKELFPLSKIFLIDAIFYLARLTPPGSSSKDSYDYKKYH